MHALPRPNESIKFHALSMRQVIIKEGINKILERLRLIDDDENAEDNKSING